MRVSEGNSYGLGKIERRKDGKKRKNGKKGKAKKVVEN